MVIYIMFSPTKEAKYGVLDRAGISSIIPELTREQQELLKHDLPEVMQTRTSCSDVGDYQSWFLTKNDIENASHKLEELLEKAEKSQPENSISEWQTAVVALQEAEETNRVLVLFSEVCRGMKACETRNASEGYTEQAKQLLLLKRQLKELGKEERYGLKIVSALKGRRMEMQTALASTVEQTWRNLIKVETTDDISILRLFPVSVDYRTFQDELEDTIKCSKVLQIYDNFVKDLGNNLFGDLQRLTSGWSISSVDKNMLQMSKGTTTEKNPILRLEQICRFFVFLEQHLFVMIPEHNFDLASALGKHINVRLTDIVRSKCISQQLPERIEDFESSKENFIRQTGELTKILLRLKWITPAADKWKFNDSVLEELYIRKCADSTVILARRFCLSEKEFSTLAKVGVHSENTSVASGSDVETTDFPVFCLQEMCVSNSIFTIKESCQTLLENSLQYSSLKLIVPSIYSIFSMFLDIVPFHFQQRLYTVPTLGALYFTSCVYASFSLHVLNRMVQTSSFVQETNEERWGISFTDLILKFRLRAYEVLNTMTEKFSQEVLDSINSGQNTWLTKIAHTQLQNLLDRAILKRGLGVLQHLGTIWKDILPATVYKQAIGKVINSVLADLAAKVICVEDITTTDSADLSKNFRWLLAEVETVFKARQKSDVVMPTKYVPSWLRFEEIILILDASMTQVMERWADGNGPLAEHFAGDELKRLVRALFENNEKRARLLAAIK